MTENKSINTVTTESCFMGKDREDKLLTFKISLIPHLMKAWNKNNFEISIILERYHLLPYIDASYEIYQTMGVKGVIEDLEAFIKEQDGC